MSQIISNQNSKHYVWGMKGWQIGALIVMSLFIICILCSGSTYIILFNSKSEPQLTQNIPSPINTLLAHELRAKIVNYLGSPQPGYPDSYWLIILIDKLSPETDVRNLSDYYNSQYPTTSSLQIDYFCDSVHATEEFARLDMSDEEYFQYIIYSYFRPIIGKTNYCLDHWTTEPCFYRSDQYVSNGGSACK
jgi:hypothetical protein